MKIENKSNDKKYFTIIPNYIANHSSANDQALYFQMKKIVGDNEGVCYASEKYFKDKLKIGSKALKKSIQYLKDHNWIDEAGSKKIKTKGGKQEIRTYIVKDIWKINVDYYQDKGVSEREPLDDKGVSESNQRGVRKETKGVAFKQQRRTINKNPLNKSKISPKDFFNLTDKTPLKEFEEKIPENILKNEVQLFILYWTEKSYNGNKCRWEMQPVFDVKRRLASWLKKTEEWGKQKQQTKTIIGLEKFI